MSLYRPDWRLGVACLGICFGVAALAGLYQLITNRKDHRMKPEVNVTPTSGEVPNVQPPHVEVEQFADPARFVALESAVKTYGLLVHPAATSEDAAADQVVGIAEKYLAFLEGDRS